MTSGQTLPGIGEEAQRVVAQATDRGELLRIAGSVAFQVRVSGRAGLPRPAPVDIDLVAPARSERRIAALLTDLGYTGEKEFNARHGDRRLIFWDQDRDRKLEVFVGIFVMCHSLPLSERLDVDAETIPLAELLLTKLQIVELNEKDLCDMHSLLITHEIGSADGDQINAQRIAGLCGADWGLAPHGLAHASEARRGPSELHAVGRATSPRRRARGPVAAGARGSAEDLRVADAGPGRRASPMVRGAGGDLSAIGR